MIKYSPNNSFCKKCGLYTKVKNPCIQGRGNLNAKMLVLGETPGCFTKDTPILTKSNSFMINDIISGSKTIDSQEIIKDFSYKVESYPMMSFKVSKFPVNTCTLNHKILISYRNTGLKNKIPEYLSKPSWLSIKEIYDLFNKGYQIFTLVPKLKYDYKENIELITKKYKTFKDYFEKKDLRLVVVEKLRDLKQGKKNKYAPILSGGTGTTRNLSV